MEKYQFLLAGVLDYLKTQEMCNKAVRIEPGLLGCIPEHFKTQEMAVRNKPWLTLVCDQYITQEMCSEVVHTMPKAFRWIPERFKTQDMCKKAVEKDSSMLKYVPDHFEAECS